MVRQLSHCPGVQSANPRSQARLLVVAALVAPVVALPVSSRRHAGPGRARALWEHVARFTTPQSVIKGNLVLGGPPATPCPNSLGQDTCTGTLLESHLSNVHDDGALASTKAPKITWRRSRRTPLPRRPRTCGFGAAKHARKAPVEDPRPLTPRLGSQSRNVTPIMRGHAYCIFETPFLDAAPPCDASSNAHPIILTTGTVAAFATWMPSASPWSSGSRVLEHGRRACRRGLEVPNGTHGTGAESKRPLAGVLDRPGTQTQSFRSN